MTITIDIKCTGCDRKHEVDVKITERSSSGSYCGLPEFSEPGHGCTWEVAEDVSCECGVTLTAEWMQNQDDINDQVQETEANWRCDA